MSAKRPLVDAKESDRKKPSGHWSQGLLHSMNDPALQVKSDGSVVVINDKYPKARHHYLVLAKDNITSLRQVKHEHLKLLKHIEKVGEELAAEHKESNFKLGYHAVPSMSRLHLHVISDDFDSIHLKTKKHWNSFTSEFFIPSTKLIKELETNNRIVSFSPEKIKELMNMSLKCHKCKYESKTMPQLKLHLKTHL